MLGHGVHSFKLTEPIVSECSYQGAFLPAADEG